MTSAGTVWGLAFGSLAAALMVIAALYPFRRRLFVGPLRSAQIWLKFHIYGSSLAALLVLAHTGFDLPNGWFGWLLWLLTIWVTASGLAGMLLQKTLPPLLTLRLRVEAIYERIPVMREELRARARQAVAGTSDVVQRFHAVEVDPILAATVVPSWSWLLGGAGPLTRSSAFEEVEALVTDAAERGRLAELRQIVATKVELDAHYGVQRLLRAWPLLHVPPAMVLLAALVAHVAAVWYF